MEKRNKSSHIYEYCYGLIWLCRYAHLSSGWLKWMAHIFVDGNFMAHIQKILSKYTKLFIVCLFLFENFGYILGIFQISFSYILEILWIFKAYKRHIIDTRHIIGMFRHISIDLNWRECAAFQRSGGHLLAVT